MDSKTCIFLLFFLVKYIDCELWKNGVVHYSINPKDYDPNSQSVITSMFRKIEQEICVKFFNTPLNYTTAMKKVLFIANPERSKDCPSAKYDFSGSVVNMAIGYKCLNSVDITRIVVDMLRASINPEEDLPASHEIKMKASHQEESNYTVMLTPKDRNYINEHYHDVCHNLEKRVDARRQNVPGDVTGKGQRFRAGLWPLGILMYGIHPSLVNSDDDRELQNAITAIEQSACVVFQRYVPGEGDEVLTPKNLLWFGTDGATEPNLGFKTGNQSIALSSMVRGAEGHVAHALNNLMRALGIPMMSNRRDRDNYVAINWKNVEQGKEYLLDKDDEENWFRDIPYDFQSVTHAPVNYLCHNCQPGQQTVTPRQDYLWQRTMAMGRSARLSESDVLILTRLYGALCQKRFQSANSEERTR